MLEKKVASKSERFKSPRLKSKLQTKGGKLGFSYYVAIAFDITLIRRFLTHSEPSEAGAPST
jgi:hypothetical protein